MRRVATTIMFKFMSKKGETIRQRWQHPILFASYTIVVKEVMSQSPFSLKMEPDKYCLKIKT